MVTPVDEISYRHIPHVSDLFRDYVEFSPRALSFYRSPATLEALEKTAREISAVSFPRSAIAGIMERQNQNFGADGETMRNIEELRQPDSVAVVTGQQVGLFAGPLYTVYKALTAIRLAAELRSRNIRAVPVFWMDTEDHDLAEVTHVTMRRADGTAASADLRDIIFERHRPEGRPVGAIRLPEEIGRAVAEYASSLPEGRWKQQIRSLLDAAYSPGADFAEAFGRLMHHIFRNSGLVLFDPYDQAAKSLLASLFRQAIESSAEIHGDLAERTRDLKKAGYVPQVALPEDSTVLFFIEQDLRRALVHTADGFALKNAGERFSRSDLMQMAGRSPELFSPNVLLRPLVQDHLLPTAAYVAGPAEVAYFAQAEVLYRFFRRPMPVIWPRAAFTLIEPEVSEGMERYSVGLSDLLKGRQRLIEKAVGVSAHSDAGHILDGLRQALSIGLDEVRPAMAAIDPSLNQAAQTAKSKVLHQVEAVRGRFARTEASLNRQLLESVDRLLNECYPNGNLQEREFGVHPFMARHGTDLVEKVLRLLDAERFVHRVLRLDPA